jgi:hypothetical protein
MPRIGGYLGEWFEYKPALVHGGMWDGQGGRVHRGVAENQDVDVDLTGSFLLGAQAARGSLDLQECSQELAWRLFSIQRDRAIQKPGLLGEFDGFGFIERGDGSDFPEAAQFSDGGLEVGSTIADVRA